MLNQPAPEFTLQSSTGESVNLADFKDRTVVLYFYPKADTPGCTKEACGFRDAIASYEKLKVPVFGISPDPVADVKSFAEKFHLNFPLLADEDHSVSEKYGVWVQKEMAGNKYMGVARTTFIIDKGKIVADGTPAELLAKSPTKRFDDVFRSLTTPDAEIRVEGGQ